MSQKSKEKGISFKGLDGLLEALSKAPQDKQGAFTIATWKMIIAEIIKIRNKLDEAEKTIQKKPNINIDSLKKDLQKKFEPDESDIILF